MPASLPLSGLLWTSSAVIRAIQIYEPQNADQASIMTRRFARDSILKPLPFA
jgi:hypothetical protein